MEYLEQKSLSTAPHPPRFWHRYVDDTFVIHKEANKQCFLQHINSVYINKTGTAVKQSKIIIKSWQAFAGFHAEAASSGH